MNSKSMIGVLLVFAGLGFCHTGQAVELLGSGKITFIENGWAGEGLTINYSKNGPAGCSAALNEFAIDKNHPAYKELVAIALAAYTSNADADLIVDPGVCLFGSRTRVISIRLKK